jgi:hypothetical protein
MPEAIENWPAHGDPDLNQDEFIAPFVDVGSGSGISSRERRLSLYQGRCFGVFLCLTIK